MLEGLFDVVGLNDKPIASHTDGFGKCRHVISDTADSSVAAMIVAPAYTAADLAAVWIDSLHLMGHAEPEGAAEIGMINSTTWDSTIVKPPAVTTKTLAHDEFG